MTKYSKKSTVYICIYTSFNNTKIQGRN